MKMKKLNLELRIEKLEEILEEKLEDMGVRQRFVHFRAIRFTGLVICSVEGVK
jgi:hypothetical protein